MLVDASLQSQATRERGNLHTGPLQAAAGAAISAALVKELRAKSGAGMMDCKKALVESNGDFEAAEVYLRNKGLISADKKASRLAAEGAVVAYVHTGSRVGVLMEVNCESDFVARGEAFKEFAEDMAMQVGPSVVFPNLRQDCQKGGTGRTRFSGFFSWVSRSA